MEPLHAEVSFSCVKHPMTMGEAICGECGHQFCSECVVFPFGTAKPPLCISCALERGGVRRTAAARPKLTRKSIRERLALQRAALEQPDASEELSPGATGAHEDEAWMTGDVDPDRTPGAWRQQY
jgi:hypothetical protein